MSTYVPCFRSALQWWIMPAHNTPRHSFRNVTVPIFSLLPGRRLRSACAAIALSLTLTLAGCASVPPPNDSMNLAQAKLQAARDAGAADYAPVDLGFAQDKFQQAQTAMAERKYADAANLAKESRADAELASAKARLGAERAQIQRKVQENTRLRVLGDQAASQPQGQPAAPADASSSTLPDQNLPVPAGSALTPPPTDGGFQTVPDNTPPAAGNQSSDPTHQGGQP